MWVVIGVIAVILLIIGVLLIPPRPASDDGPLPQDEETQVLLGEVPDPPGAWSPAEADADDDDARR
jgi:hypothetical protein